MTKENKKWSTKTIKFKNGSQVTLYLECKPHKIFDCGICDGDFYESMENNDDQRKG